MPTPSPKPSDAQESFGRRLARLRKERGLSQRDLAKESGISQRMVAYYETETRRPPAHLLPTLAKILRVSADQLLGLAELKPGPARDSRLWRRFSQADKLPPQKRRQVVMLLDTILQANKAQAGA